MDAAEVKKTLNNISDLSTIPTIVGKIISIVDKEDSSFKELDSLITHDQSVAEQVIRVANSTLFGHSGQVRDLKQAIMFLGFNQIRSIAAGMSIMKIFPPNGAFNLKNLWIHSYEVALISSMLSDVITMTCSGECFLSGLLHDIGRIIFYKIDHRQFYKILTTDDMLEKEMELFGCTHAEAGAWFAEIAGMPLEIVSSIRNHHNPSMAREFKDSASIISLAEALSRMYSPRVEDDGLWTKEHDAILLELRIDKPVFAAVNKKFYGSNKEAELFFNQ
jgi:putative nucleotidyltransferase with HDIG domain